MNFKEGLLVSEHGFTITFKNGITVGVLVKHPSGLKVYSHVNGTYNGFPLYDAVEVAIWDKNGELITRRYKRDLLDDVIGMANMDEVANVLKWASNYRRPIK